MSTFDGLIARRSIQALSSGRERGAVTLAAAIIIGGCGQWVSPTDSSASDAITEATSPDVALRDDARIDVVAIDADAVAMDVAAVTDARDVVDVADVTDVIDAAADASTCSPPAEPRPTRSLRSCSGANGAPSEHCREVWSCGGLTPVGSTEAFNYNDFVPNAPQRVGCEIGRVNVHAGFIDAYEVSVARLRAWALAGYPQPPDGTRTYPWQWFSDDHWFHHDFEEPLRNCPMSDPLCGAPPIDRANCVYRGTPGENDNLPVNCVTIYDAFAFCRWEGKHLVTEGAWEHFATNRGTTRRPFASGALGTFDECMFADVASCPRTSGLPFAIDARPLGQSLDPPGVFGLWGGLREIVSYNERTGQECLVRDGQDEGSDDRWGRIGSLRGRSFRDTGEVAVRYGHAATRGNEDWYRASIGFRCARWVPEPGDLRE